MELILRDYWWPRISQDVKRYVEGCETCQQTKTKRTPTNTPLHPFTLPTRPLEVISMDIIGLLPESQGYNAILVIVDWLTKAVKFEATNMELTSEEGTARILRDRRQFHGELRAIGDVLIDEIPLMLRCGFDSFEVTNAPTLHALQAGRLPGSPLHYQPSSAHDEAHEGTRPWLRVTRPSTDPV